MNTIKQAIENELGTEIFNIERIEDYINFTDCTGRPYYAKATKADKLKKGSVRAC